MQNYIPLDFFDNNKGTVYASENACLKYEGSAIKFNPQVIDVSVSKMENGEVVECEIKKAAKELAQNEKEIAIDSRRKLIKSNNKTLKERLNALIEHLGIE